MGCHAENLSGWEEGKKVSGKEKIESQSTEYICMEDHRLTHLAVIQIKNFFRNFLDINRIWGFSWGVHHGDDMYEVLRLRPSKGIAQEDRQTILSKRVDVE